MPSLKLDAADPDDSSLAWPLTCGFGHNLTVTTVRYGASHCCLIDARSSSCAAAIWMRAVATIRMRKGRLEAVLAGLPAIRKTEMDQAVREGLRVRRS